MNNSIVDVSWLKNRLKDKNLIILDASQQSVQSNETSAFQNIRIKGARVFDLKNSFSNPSGKYPNTFPKATQFQTACRKLGINQSSRIVVYDNLGIYTSPRVWWMFGAMGHHQVHVLDGGLPAWIQAGYDVEPVAQETYDTGNFVSTLNHNVVKDMALVTSNIATQKELLIDARSSARFDGTAPEPRENLRSGHIPGSINIPYKSVLEDGKFKSKNALLQIFDTTAIKEQPLVFSCGSGVTACILLLAAEQVLDNPKSVYDGSWTEWASENEQE